MHETSQAAMKSAKSSCGSFIGMDEAGYGPNLGPLVIAVTRWSLPCEPGQCDFYKLLSDILCREGTCRETRLHIADSKLVNVGRFGFRSLETSALALLRVLGKETGSINTLCERLVDPRLTRGSQSPWDGEDLDLPVAADPKSVDGFARVLHDCMERSGVRLQEVHADVVNEFRFNQLVEQNGVNKGLTLSRLAFQLLRRVWSPETGSPSLVVGDRHGGRKRYDELLAEVLDGEMIFRLEETPHLSRYRVSETELRFQVGGEAHLPVACASIIAKYLRELSMVRFNRFWKGHCPDVRPTLGYPVDAKRFRDDVEPVRKQLKIADEIFWRMK